MKSVPRIAFSSRCLQETELVPLMTSLFLVLFNTTLSNKHSGFFLLWSSQGIRTTERVLPSPVAVEGKPEWEIIQYICCKVCCVCWQTVWMGAKTMFVHLKLQCCVIRERTACYFCYSVLQAEENAAATEHVDIIYAITLGVFSCCERLHWTC